MAEPNTVEEWLALDISSGSDEEFDSEGWSTATNHREIDNVTGSCYTKLQRDCLVQNEVLRARRSMNQPLSQARSQGGGGGGRPPPQMPKRGRGRERGGERIRPPPPQENPYALALSSYIA